MATAPPSREHLTSTDGLGVMLEVVVGVGWKCTPAGHEPCHLLFNLGEHYSQDATPAHRRRRRERHSQWHGGTTYPEFRYRRPPPSYNASMQDYQQQLMLAQLQLNSTIMAPPSAFGDDDYSLPSSAPPSYKSRTSTSRPPIHITFPPQAQEHPRSRPPTYSSRAGTGLRPALNTHVLSASATRAVGHQVCLDADVPTSSTSVAEVNLQNTWNSGTANRGSVRDAAAPALPGKSVTPANVDITPPTAVTSSAVTSENIAVVTLTSSADMASDGVMPSMARHIMPSPVLPSAVTQPLATTSDMSTMTTSGGESHEPGVSTLHRLGEVVEYLDNVLEDEDKNSSIDYNSDKVNPSDTLSPPKPGDSLGNTQANGTQENTTHGETKSAYTTTVTIYRDNSSEILTSEDDVRIRDTPL